ncbi:exo-beta-N-acetylmuramidase NamZ family protein [Desulfobacula sp.]
MKNKIAIGLEELIARPPEYLKGKRLGLLSNPASIDNQFNHASRLIHHFFPGQLKTLFSPQHGFYAEKQDNMIESDHFLEPQLNIPVYSLYNDTRIPTKKMFDQIDVLLVDIQDVGTRVYTFIYTVSYCLEVAARLKKKVIILDRPNPIGGTQVEGNILSKDYASFVGRFPVPMRHGLTIGEISQFFNQEFHIECDLTVIPMKGWRRQMYWQDTCLPWIPPSPNLPTPQSCMVYPGQVIFEGTNISEGRGTTLPFEQFGAPFLDTKKIKAQADEMIKGAFYRPVNFEPTSGKWKGNLCKGFQIHITSKEEFKPYLSSLILMQLIIKNHKNKFKFKEPPYEYEFKQMPIDLILGSKTLRKKLTALEDLIALSNQWSKELKKFKSISGKYHLYE